jgi:hypothetical protein
VIVVGCGKRKLGVSAPACELYTGSLFVAARKYAEASGQKWAILSAAHGMVSPETVLEPYDVKLKLKGPALASWALDAARDCGRLQQQWGLRESVEVLAGHPYAWPFRNELWWAEDLPSTEPLEGLGLGARLRWLSQALARVTSKPELSAPQGSEARP